MILYAVGFNFILNDFFDCSLDLQTIDIFNEYEHRTTIQNVPLDLPCQDVGLPVLRLII